MNLTRLKTGIWQAELKIPEAAEAATQAELIAKGLIETH